MNALVESPIAAEERAGDWFVLFTGNRFWPLDPRPEDIEIEDIAHALSNICRFGGHSLRFSSVAQHSVFVSELLPPEYQMCGLLHDATEAYCGDVVRPLKYAMPIYRQIEDRIWVAVAIRFNLPVQIPREVKDADNVALLTERRDNLRETGYEWGLEKMGYLPSPRRFIPMPPEEAKAMFLARYAQLMTTNTNS